MYKHILSFPSSIHSFSKESSPVPASAGSQKMSKDSLHEVTSLTTISNGLINSNHSVYLLHLVKNMNMLQSGDSWFWKTVQDCLAVGPSLISTGKTKSKPFFIQTLIE